MPKLLQALFISAVATGVAAVLLEVMSKDRNALPKPRPSDEPFVQAEQFTPAEREALLREFDAQL